MKTNTKKRISSLVLVVALTFGTAVPALAASVNVGGGTWDYGTRAKGWNVKEVYSNYLHNTKIHKASCSIGANKSDSGWTAPGDTASSSAEGKWGDKTHAYHAIK
ncbi:MAG TPA: lactococcin 972 family bacteriocin [Ruminococcaceae bacterium]|jgi:lactococcin 972 family bacteriocin|nr:lactococcin 972 family bacteriocin [Oscillospiraceae bacterium]